MMTSPLRWDALVGGALCLAGVLFPFSIAGANIALGLALAVGMLSGLWWRGTIRLWRKTRPLFLALLLYLALMPIGLLWSDNLSRGIVIIAKQWSWLLLPLSVQVFQNDIWKHRFFLAISIGLSGHLVLCILQAFGIPLPLTFPGGSSKDDPAGLIGHIGFGLIYGMWAAWLTHQATFSQGWRKWWQLGLATFSILMIFVVQGRSGYLIAIILIGLMFWKLWLRHHRPPAWLAISIALVLIIGVLALGAKNDRIQWTIHSLQAFLHGDLQHSEARLSLWYAAIKGWQQHPILGLGTGGFPHFARQLAEQNPQLAYSTQLTPSHPHQQYLMALARWGMLGLLLLLLLFWQWWKADRYANWQRPHTALPLITGAALATHGLSAPSLEEYYGSIYGTLLLGLGLAALSLPRKEQ